MSVDVPLVRDVTDEETELFGANGWLKLDGVVDPALVQELLHRAQQRTGCDGDSNVRRDGDIESTFFNHQNGLALEDEAFGALERAYGRTGRSRNG